MKRAFKVATAFTGVAACATIMAPAADAGAAVVPYTANNCTLAEANWVHLYYSVNQKHTTPACFGNNGVNRITNGQKFSAFCAGNNYGQYNDIFGGIVNFYPGSSYVFRSPQYIASVDIFGHAHSNRPC